MGSRNRKTAVKTCTKRKKKQFRKAAYTSSSEDYDSESEDLIVDEVEEYQELHRVVVSTTKKKEPFNQI